MQEVNPTRHMKRKSRSDRQRSKLKDYGSVLAGIERGIKHLHSLGLVHTDVNPSNIMLDWDEAVIIDFGSCRRVGESLEGVLIAIMSGTTIEPAPLFRRMISTPWKRFGYG